MRLRTSLISALTIFAVIALLPTATYASTMRLKIEVVGGSSVVLIDDGAGDMASATLGQISTFGVGLSGVTISFLNATSKPVTPPTSDGEFVSQLALTSFVINSTSAHQVRLTLEDTGYTSGVGAPDLSLINRIGGDITGNASLTTQAWANIGDLAPDLSLSTNPLVAPAGSVTTGVQTFSGSGSFSGDRLVHFVDNAGTYSLFSQVIINFGGSGGTVGFHQDTLVATPEPRTLLLMGTGLLGLARIARRRRVSGASLNSEPVA